MHCYYHRLYHLNSHKVLLYNNLQGQNWSHMVKGMDEWSLNPFLDTLYIELKSPDLNFFLFADHVPATLFNQYESISDLKENSAQSWGHIEAFGDTISPKTSSQQPCSWSTMTWNTLYVTSIVRRLRFDSFLPKKSRIMYVHYITPSVCEMCFNRHNIYCQ